MGEDVPPVHVPKRGVYGALPQEKQHRNGLLHDKGQVRERPTFQERYWPDKRGALQGVGAQHLRARTSHAHLQHPSDSGSEIQPELKMATHGDF